MELELKHIQNYPLQGNNLKIVDPNGYTASIVGIITTDPFVQVDFDTAQDDVIIRVMYEYGGHKPDYDFATWGISQIKPLLLPMSSLYTEMEDGKVPIVEIYKKMFIYPQIKEYRIEDGCLKFGKHTFEWADEFRAFSLDGDTAYITIEVSDYLDSLHFDWRYGLIDKGLALDKTKIK